MWPPKYQPIQIKYSQQVANKYIKKVFVLDAEEAKALTFSGFVNGQSLRYHFHVKIGASGILYIQRNNFDGFKRRSSSKKLEFINKSIIIILPGHGSSMFQMFWSMQVILENLSVP